ncbi:SAGA-associated factor 29 [Galendromus occidentalis]|uniref:SAGA-associated factor 29 n=1 Tax=Galendromus occidentalis TaxID=34638 RepID=A0AAJ6QRI8_9ACAR|nr:SAGA-associated factor 29 [Galendromus occidentalis]
MSVAVHHRQNVPALQESLKELAHLMRNIQALRHETQREIHAAVLAKHCALKEQEKDKKISSETKHELKKCFWRSIDSCENEENALRMSLDVIKNIRLANSARSGFLSGLGRTQRGEVVRKSALMMNLKTLARQLPLWVPTDHEKPPPLCGAVPAPPGHEAEPHSMVAAFVKNDDDEEWILARVRHYDRTSGRYQVDDIDDEHPETLTLLRKHIIPLPLMRANPITNPEAFFPKGTVVNALYPQTTCFYRGLVDEIPHGPQEGYSVQFEDENYPGGFAPALVVEQLYVIECVL